VVTIAAVRVVSVDTPRVLARRISVTPRVKIGLRNPVLLLVAAHDA
jgi:hypothetical protein